jgi:hypothetical protein
VRTRFTQPDFTAVDEVPEDIASTPKPPSMADAVALEMFVQPAHLHVLRDKDKGTVDSHWKVALYIRSHLGNVCLLESRCASRDGDTPDSVASEFAAAMVNYIGGVL